MWPFSKRARLLRMLEKLALYNDKAAIYARHTSQQSHTEPSQGQRYRCSHRCPESFLPEFIEAIKSGELASDFTAKYIDLLKAQFA